jgi:hypothetical protein
MSAPLTSSPAQLRETGSIAKLTTKEKNTESFSPVKTVQHEILSDVRTHAVVTGSLVVALRSTMALTTGKRPIVIPGIKKRESKERVGELSQLHRLSRSIRSGIPLTALVVFGLFSLFSLSSLADGSPQFPIVGDAIRWVRAGPINWSLFIGDRAPVTQVAPDNTGSLFLPASDYVAIARQAAISAGIPPNYFVLQIKRESNFNPNAVSPAGAVGIAQFLPSTAAGLGINPYDPIESLYGAARYMARLNSSYGGDYAKALAAYNAGSANVNRAVDRGGANWLAYMPLETQHYVHAIMG